jgi:hypothetical protein
LANSKELTVKGYILETEAIAARGLSLGHAPIDSLLTGKLRTGILLGSMLASMTFPLVGISFGDLRPAGIMLPSLMAAGGGAATVDPLLPRLLHRLALRPAFGSGPIASIVQEVLSLSIYFVFFVAIVARRGHPCERPGQHMTRPAVMEASHCAALIESRAMLKMRANNDGPRHP